VALVTGAGTRLGRAIAEGLGAAGADVAVHFHQNRAGADEAVASIKVDGNRAEAFDGDLTRADAPAALAKAVEAKLGPVDLLVNSASLLVHGAFTELSPETLERLWALNVRAPVLLTQALVPGFVARGKGEVVNIVDLAGTTQIWRDAAAYQSTRAALWNLTQSLALELAPIVRVNAVAPGLVLPPPSMSGDTVEKLTARIPQKRSIAPREIVEAVLFCLTGPKGMTGQLVTVDGGRHLSTS
jgi:NAD(P)-dependent dehydrogenase (short-subunit alcohol dehydrogenase family)